MAHTWNQRRESESSMRTAEQYENLAAWAKRLKTNPPKTMGVLIDGNGMCCLGVACSMFLAPNVIDGYGHSFSGHTCNLPASIAGKFGIERYGDLTISGQRLARSFFATSPHWKPESALSELNDNLDTDHNAMGQFIEWALCRELLFGEEIFE